MKTLLRNLADIKGLRFTSMAPMAPHTSMQVGGPAAILAEARDVKAMSSLLLRLSEIQRPWFILGGGTNTIFHDECFDGVVIQLGENFRFIKENGNNHITVGAETPLSQLVAWSIQKGLGGLEFCTGIPGSIGGSTAGNAGTNGLGFHNRIKKIHGLSKTGLPIELEHGDYSYSYRHMEAPDMIISSVELCLEETDPVTQQAQIRKYNAMRSRQPVQKGSSGSIFKNPSGDFAGRLIDAVGLKGFRIGDAVISDRHANWIINEGHATADEVLSLIRLAREKVNDVFNIILEPEVCIVA